MSQDSLLCLGAMGDICAILPYVQSESSRTKTKVPLVVAKDYASLLDGCSYVIPVVYPGSYRDIPGALNFAVSQGLSPRVIQAGFNPALKPSCESFVIDMWNLAGHRDDWFYSIPFFDRRDKKREAALLKSVGRTPDILVALDGRSSPFPESPDLASLLSDRLPGANILNLSAVRAERLYDLLALYERAKLIISIDTCHLHLSRAVGTPVIALVTDTRSRWHGCPPYFNQVLRVRYSEYESRKDEIVRMARRVLRGTFGAKAPRVIHHVYSEYPRTGGTLRRHAMARRTWESEYLLGPWEQHQFLEGARDSRSVGDARQVPFISDMLDAAAKRAEDRDVLVLTNDDTCFAPGLTQEILSKVDDGPLFAHRWDSLEMIEEPLYKQQLQGLRWYAGCDLFAFTVGWWRHNRHRYPDGMLLGSEAWDKIMRELVKSDSGVELHQVIYHERHETKWWSQRETLPGNIHNRKLARAWLMERGLPIQELANVT